MALSKHYKCIDNVVAALAAIAVRDVAKAAEQLGEAVSDPELDAALAELDSMQETASALDGGSDAIVEADGVAGSGPEGDDDGEAEQASLDAERQDHIKRNIAAL